MDETDIKALMNTVWDYTKMGAKLEPADAIIAMGSMDMRVAERAADLWQQKLAPVIVVTGGLGRLTGDDVTVSEAAKFAAVLRACGIPDEAVLIEDKASNGAENFTFSVAMACVICDKEITPAVAVAGLLDADNRQQFACNGHFWNSHQLITGWADFMARERRRRTGNQFAFEYGEGIDARTLR